MDSAKILQFLQKFKFDLMREIPGFNDAFLSDDGKKLVLCVSNPLSKEASFTFEDEIVPIEVKVTLPNSPSVNKAIVIGDVLKPSSINSNNEDRLISSEKIAIHPYETGGRNKESFEAFKKRHNHVKIV